MIIVNFEISIVTLTKQNKIVNRPLAGTIRRGKTTEEDEMLERHLLNDPKQCAEHTMLVDLGRNDVGKVIKLTIWMLLCISQISKLKAHMFMLFVLLSILAG